MLLLRRGCRRSICILIRTCYQLTPIILKEREKKRWRNVVLSSYADCWPLPQLIMKMLPCGNLATILSCPIRPRKWLVSHPRSALGDSASFEDSIGSLQSGHNLPKLLKLFEILSILNSKPIHSATQDTKTSSPLTWPVLPVCNSGETGRSIFRRG